MQSEQRIIIRGRTHNEVLESIYDSDIFFERSRGRFYLNQTIRLVVRHHYEGCMVGWEIYKFGEYTKGYPMRRYYEEKWFRISTEELLKVVNVKTAKKILFNLDIVMGN